MDYFSIESYNKFVDKEITLLSELITKYIIRSITGIVKSKRGRGFIISKHDPENNEFYFKEIDEFRDDVIYKYLTDSIEDYVYSKLE